MPAVQISGKVEYDLDRIGCALQHTVEGLVAVIFDFINDKKVGDGEGFGFLVRLRDREEDLKVRAFKGTWLAFIKSARDGVVFNTFRNKQDAVEWLLLLDEDITAKEFRRL